MCVYIHWAFSLPVHLLDHLSLDVPVPHVLQFKHCYGAMRLWIARIIVFTCLCPGITAAQWGVLSPHRFNSIYREPVKRFSFHILYQYSITCITSLFCFTIIIYWLRLVFLLMHLTAYNQHYLSCAITHMYSFSVLFKETTKLTMAVPEK